MRSRAAPETSNTNSASPASYHSPSGVICPVETIRSMRKFFCSISVSNVSLAAMPDGSPSRKFPELIMTECNTSLGASDGRHFTHRVHAMHGRILIQRGLELQRIDHRHLNTRPGRPRHKDEGRDPAIGRKRQLFELLFVRHHPVIAERKLTIDALQVEGSMEADNLIGRPHRHLGPPSNPRDGRVRSRWLLGRLAGLFRSSRAIVKISSERLPSVSIPTRFSSALASSTSRPIFGNGSLELSSTVIRMGSVAPLGYAPAW